MIIGIQGEKGSGTEEGCIELCNKKGFLDYKIEYLTNTLNVFEALYNDKIDYGFFAVKTTPCGQFTNTLRVQILFWQLRFKWGGL